MDAEQVEEFWQAITVIESQEVLLGMKIADFPHLTKSARSSAHKEFFKQAFPRTFREVRIVTWDDVAQLAGGGRGKR